MRKPRDYDAELKALDDKAKRLKACKMQQLASWSPRLAPMPCRSSNSRVHC
jgi:hypothetical protein